MGLTSSSLQASQFALSPDGRAMVFVASSAGSKAALWLRRFDNAEPQPLAGTTGASYPFWSADSLQIGFFADQQLKRIPAATGAPEPVCDAPNGRGGTWNAQGEIVFAPDNYTPLFRVRASGGKATPLLTSFPADESHRWPQFLPDGRHLLFLVKSDDAAVEGLYVTSLEAPAEMHRVRAASNGGLYSAGHVLYVADGVLMAQPFDVQTLAVSGNSVSLRLPVSVTSNFSSAFSTTESGVLATWSAGHAISELKWFDRRGTTLGTVEAPGRYVDFSLSPRWRATRLRQG